MDRKKAESMLVDARAELITAESAVLYLKQVVSGLEGLLKTAPLAPPTFIDPPAQPNADEDAAGERSDSDEPEVPRLYPSPRAADLEVLRSRPNWPWTFKAVWAELTSRDLIDPSIKSGRNAYTNAISRLAKDPASGVVRDEHDRFIYQTTKSEDDESGDESPKAIRLKAVEF